MRKLSSIVLLLVIVLALSSCEANENRIIPSDAVVSPNGKYALSSNVQEDIEDGEGKLYSIYEVTLFDMENNTLICTFPIVGKYFSFLWDSNSRYAVAIYWGRLWTNFSILDVLGHNHFGEITMPQIIDEFTENGDVFSYTYNTNRPDPQIYPLEWSPDNKKLLIAYSWTDTEYYRQSGVFIYAPFDSIGKLSNLIQYEPSASDHVEVKKPDDFEWTS